MEPTVVTDTPLIDEIREKTFDQILREQAATRSKDSTKSLEPQETDEEKKKKDDVVKAEQEAKEKATIAEADKHDAEVAAKAAQDVLDKQLAEEQKKADALKAEEAEKKRLEDLKPKFTGKDEKGNVSPLNYEELTAESVRIAKEEAKREILAELAAKEQAIKAEQDKAQQTVEQQKAQQKSIEDSLQKELDRDLKALYAANDMPKIGDPKDENDPGNKAFKHLFETAQRVNGERIGKGLDPIRSIQVIRYGKDENGKPFYTPLAPLAGHDAPVFGSESSLSNEPPEDQYIPSRDRSKSMTQLVKEEAARLAKKLNVRGR